MEMSCITEWKPFYAPLDEWIAANPGRYTISETGGIVNGAHRFSHRIAESEDGTVVVVENKEHLEFTYCLVGIRQK